MAELNYPRTYTQRKNDHDNARRFENEVGDWLGQYKIGHLDATDKMYWWVPGVYLDAKEKAQPISGRWPLPAGCRNEDAFILDELSIRRAMQHHPHAYFVMRDKPLDRTFLARVDEVMCGDRIRIDRVGSTGHKKGKWVVDLSQFRELKNPAVELLSFVLGDQIALAWKQSGCLIPEGTSS